ncbi:MAG: hypothetical protein GF333_03275 [Candidatus Omnitrophica bacterium]|nr:hypothetical protein [Candidatus Omnitrophota bacterium]
MKTVRINELRPGMKVVKEVKDAQGMLVCPADTPVSERLKELCLRRGVEEVWIAEEQDAAETRGTVRETPEQIRKRVREKFAPYMEDPVMARLCELAQEYLLRREEM